MIDKKELLELIVTERIQTLTSQMDSQKADEKDSVSLLIDQVEVILTHLPEPNRDTLNRFVEHPVDRMVGKDSCLYIGGFKDGIRVMKMIGEL